MKKILSLVLSAALLVGAGMPTFADGAKQENKYDKAAKTLQGYGAVKGDPKLGLNLEGNFSRSEAGIVLSRIQTKDADQKIKSLESGIKLNEKVFNDVIYTAKANNKFWVAAAKYVKNHSKVMVGYPDNTYRGKQQVTAQEYATMMLRAMGYSDKATTKDFTFETSLAKAKELGLLKDTDKLTDKTPLKRKHAFLIMNNAFNSQNKAGKLVKHASGYVAKPANLEVESIKANGLKVINVKFNNEVCPKSIKNIEVENKSVENRVLSDDKKTVFVVLDKKATQGATRKVIVKDVKSFDKKQTVKKVEKEIKMLDTTTPEIKSVEVVNPKVIKFVTSEPINKEASSYDYLSEIKIDGKKAYAKVVNVYKNEFSIQLYKAMTSGEHKLLVAGLKDFADLPVKALEKTINVKEDKDAPKVVKAEVINVDTIKVIFDEPLSKVGTFKVNGYTAKAKKAANSENEVELDLNDSHQLDMGAVFEVRVNYKGQRDIMGNEVKEEQLFTFKIADDTELPKVSFLGFDKDDSKKAMFKFTKSMQATKGKYALKSTDGLNEKSAAVVAGDWKENNTVLVIALDATDPKDYKATFEGFVDNTVRKNQMGKTTLEFTSKDNSNPTHSGYKAVEKDDVWKVKIFFNEKMDRSTVESAANWTLKNGTTTKRLDTVGGSAYLLDDQKTALLKFKDDKWAFVAGTHKIVMEGVKDLAGNQPDSTNKTVSQAALANVSAPTPSSVKIIQDSENKQFIRFTYGKNVRVKHPSYFTMKDSKGDISIAYAGDTQVYGTQHDFEIVSKTFNADLSDLDGAKYSIKEDAVTTPVGAGSDEALNKSLNANDNDGILPVLDTDKEVKLSADKKSFEFHMSENVTATTANTVVVVKDGNTVSSSNISMSVSGAKVSVSTTATFTAGDYEIWFEVKDVNGNLSKRTKIEKNVR